MARRRRLAWICLILPSILLVPSVRLSESEQEKCAKADDQDFENQDTYDRSSNLEDVSTHDFVHALGSDTAPLWLALVDMIAEKVSSHPEASLLQVNQSMAGEHHLVRRMWKKIHKVSTQEPKEVNDEQGDGICAWLEKPKSEEHLSPITELDKGTLRRQNVKELEETDDTSIPTDTKRSSSNAVKEAFKRSGRVIIREGMDIGTRIGKAALEMGSSIKKFFFDFLRWDFTFVFFSLNLGFSLPQLGTPVLGFKCQPIKECFKGMASMLRDILKLFAVLAKELLHLLYVLLLQAPIAFFGKTLPDFHDFGGKIKAFFTGGSNSDSDAIMEVEANEKPPEKEVSPVILDTNRLAKDPCIQHARLKGSISYSFPSLSLANVKFMIGTVPLPFSKWWVEAKSCVRQNLYVAKQVFQHFRGKPSENTKRYFSPDQCNPHTVGLCMLLEKTRQCKVKLERNEITSLHEDNKMKPTKAMEDFCNTFKGVSVSLTKTVDDGRVHCAADLRARAKFNESKVQKFDFGQGCHLVREHMNKKGAECKLTKLEDAFLYCRRLYGCSHQRSSPKMLLKWESYVSRVMDTVSHFVDLKNDGETSKRVSQKIQRVAQQGEDFQAQVDAAMDSDSAGDDLDPGAIFMHPLWNDGCFEQLSPLIPAPAEPKKGRFQRLREKLSRSKGKETETRDGLYELHWNVNEKNPGDQQTFFHRLAQGISITSWGKCPPSNFPHTEKPDRHAALPSSSMSQFLIKFPGGFQIGPNNDNFTIMTPGWASKASKTTLQKTQDNLWVVRECEGRHCSDMREGVKLLSLRVQMVEPVNNDQKDNEQVNTAYSEITSICNSASAVMNTIRKFRAADSNSNSELQQSEESYIPAAELLEGNAKIMEANDKIKSEEHGFKETIFWSELAKLLDATSVDVVSKDKEDDPLGKVKTTMDNYVHSRYLDGHRRNKLEMFLRRRGWALVRSQDDNELVLVQNGQVATVAQLRTLAAALREPRSGAVVGTGIALHSLAVDLLNGAKQKVLFMAPSFGRLVGADARDGIIQWLESVQPRYSRDECEECNLALVTVDYSLIPHK
eukprot:TRINITY_DN24116_c0_g1_i1.p1 TRINITY_DN24116_c0_g1~~TRINITY_DN24116_c0_g1_i1.p1  ORF type:complete len:1067 (+),score=109.56 TRINITY_DN24116_c0_g1_i1:90-3290(+)